MRPLRRIPEESLCVVRQSGCVCAVIALRRLSERRVGSARVRHARYLDTGAGRRSRIAGWPARMRDRRRHQRVSACRGHPTLARMGPARRWRRRRSRLTRCSASSAATRRSCSEGLLTMCGIAGFVGFGSPGHEGSEETAMRMGLAIAHRGPDDAGNLVRPGCRGGAGAPPVVDHRTFGGGPSTDVVAIRTLRRGLQRRNLQPRRTARATAHRAGLEGALRHRNPAGRFRSLGHRGDAQASHRHVRDRGMGPSAARADAGSRPRRREAAVLRARTMACCCSARS